MTNSILVTGAAGYIGSHAVLRLVDQGYNVIALDDLSKGSEERLKVIEQLTAKNIPFFKCEVGDEKELISVFEQYDIDAVMHFAGLKSVSESLQKPSQYYQNNIAQSLTLLEVMERYSVRKLIFSSSATVYNSDCQAPVSELSPIGKTSNPYGTTKYFLERILKDLTVSDPNWSIISLRYFNPVGAHESGAIGEDILNDPTNLVPLISQVLFGMRENLVVFGDDYDTKDGTGIRDYIHVMDLVDGHIAALNRAKSAKGYDVYNLGTGSGYSVLEVVSAFKEITGRALPVKIGERRSGDIAISYADTRKAASDLNWCAQYSLTSMIKHHWNWCLNHYDKV